MVQITVIRFEIAIITLRFSSLRKCSRLPDVVFSISISLVASSTVIHHLIRFYECALHFEGIAVMFALTCHC